MPEGVVVTYHVLENPVLKGVNLSGNTVESTDVLQGLITMKTGEILNSRELNKDVMAIQEQYRRDGYILAKITDMNIDKNGILNLKVNEGILEGYKVKGNTKTKERVILREMRQKPGEPFNSKLARRSMQRVYNLGFRVSTRMPSSWSSTSQRSARAHSASAPATRARTASSAWSRSATRTSAARAMRSA